MKANIADNSARLGAEAARGRRKPLDIWPGDAERMRRGAPGFELPVLEIYPPQGWVCIGFHFVNPRGAEAPDASALTYDRFLDQLVIGHGYAVLGAMRTPLVIGEFQPILERKESSDEA